MDVGQEVFHIFSLEICFKISLLAKAKAERVGLGWQSCVDGSCLKCGYRYLCIDFRSYPLSPGLGLAYPHSGGCSITKYSQKFSRFKEFVSQRAWLNFAMLFKKKK